MQETYEKAQKNSNDLNEALQHFVAAIREAGNVKHKVYGECDVLSVDERYVRLKIRSTGAEKQLGLAVVVKNGIVKVETAEFDDKRTEYMELLKNADSIPRNLEYAARALKPYEEYLN